MAYVVRIDADALCDTSKVLPAACVKWRNLGEELGRTPKGFCLLVADGIQVVYDADDGVNEQMREGFKTALAIRGTKVYYITRSLAERCRIDR